MAVLGLIFSRGGGPAEAAGPRSLAALAAFAAYGVLMPLLGFLTATVLFCAGFVAGIGTMRTAWRWILVCMLFAGAVYLAFTSLFMVSFPAGVLR